MKRILLVSAALLAVSACENLSDQQNRALVGGGVGAAGGAVLGEVIADDAATGAVLGGVGGAAAGGLTKRGDIPGEDIFYGSDDDK